MMSSDIAGKLLLIVFFLLCSAYFSATETAFSSLSKTRVRAMAERGNRRAELVLSLAERYDDLLSTILVGNNIVNIALPPWVPFCLSAASVRTWGLLCPPWW